jgi:hypothetical protein
MISMGKLKWDWLGSLEGSEPWEKVGVSMITAFFSGIFTFLGCVVVQGGILGASGPDGLTAIVCGVAVILSVLTVCFGERLHYAYGLDRDQARAIEWYDSLSKKEKAQLPAGWDKAIREVGAEDAGTDKYFYRHTVARNMHQRAQNVIDLYRQSQEEAKVPDYRIELYKDLMEQRAQELKQSIKDRKEIEAKIAGMK